MTKLGDSINGGTLLSGHFCIITWMDMKWFDQVQLHPHYNLFYSVFFKLFKCIISYYIKKNNIIINLQLGNMENIVPQLF